MKCLNCLSHEAHPQTAGFRVAAGAVAATVQVQPLHFILARIDDHRHPGPPVRSLAAERFARIQAGISCSSRAPSQWKWAQLPPLERDASKASSARVISDTTSSRPISSVMPELIVTLRLASGRQDGIGQLGSDALIHFRSGHEIGPRHDDGKLLPADSASPGRHCRARSSTVRRCCTDVDRRPAVRSPRQSCPTDRCRSAAKRARPARRARLEDLLAQNLAKCMSVWQAGQRINRFVGARFRWRVGFRLLGRGTRRSGGFHGQDRTDGQAILEVTAITPAAFGGIQGRVGALQQQSRRIAFFYLGRADADADL